MNAQDTDAYRRRIYQDYAASIDPDLRGASLPGLDANDAVFSRDYIPLLPTDRDAKILDAGCGRGNFLSFLQRNGYTRGSGVDRSPESVRAARAAGLDVAEGDAMKTMAAHPGTYDAIVAIDVLEHLRKDEALAFVDAAFTALKPGGVLLTQTVNAESPFFGRMLHIDFTHEIAFTRHSLHQLFMVAGFGETGFREIAPIGAGPRALLRRGLWAIARWKMNLYLHIETGSGLLNNEHLFTQIFLAKARKPG